MPNTLTWYGHATLGLQTAGYNLLIDPFFSGNPASPISAEAVNADFILITHGHGDHVGDSVAIAARTGATIISNFEICNWLKQRGVEKTHAQHLGGGFKHPFGYLKLTLALHGSSLPDGAYGGSPAGLLLTTHNGKKIYFGGDTGLFGDMRLIGEETLDLAILPIGDNFTMGPDDALRAVKLLTPKVVIPIHYNTWSLIDQNALEWATRVETETTSQAVVLTAGQPWTLA